MRWNAFKLKCKNCGKSVITKKILNPLCFECKEINEITVYFTSGKTEKWNRGKLMVYIEDRIAAGHSDDIADFIFYQLQQQNQQQKNDKNFERDMKDFDDGQDGTECFRETERVRRKMIKDIKKGKLK